MKPSERQLFDDTLVRSVAERGAEVMRCATMLFLGMVDDATTFAETRGGGGGGSDLNGDVMKTRTTGHGRFAA